MAGSLCEDAPRKAGTRPAYGDGHRKLPAGTGGSTAVERPQEEGGAGAHSHDDLRAGRYRGAAHRHYPPFGVALPDTARRTRPHRDPRGADGSLPLHARPFR